MIDTHVHLNSSRFRRNRDETVAAAHAAGVDVLIVPGTDVKDSRLAVDLAAQYDRVYAAVGVHPHDALDIEPDWDALESLLVQPKVVAVGETGLDAHYTGSVSEAQLNSFRRHVELATRYNMPLIIHSRQATEELLNTLREMWDSTLENNAVLHCCESDQRLFSFAQEHGWYIGIDGDVTYDSDKANFISTVPLDMLLLETDAPYLLPEPLKSQRKYPNEPANLPITAQKVAEVKGITLEEVDNQTTKNARALFQIPTLQS